MKNEILNMTETKEDVFKSIMSVGTDTGAILAKRFYAPTPGTNELDELCELLSQNPKEELLQKYFEQNVGYLTGLFGTDSNSDLAVLFKPPIGTQFKADFCVLQSYQGGAVAHLIEIEPSHEQVFTKQLMPARRYQGALAQIRNWRDAINKDIYYHSKEFIRMAKETPLIGKEEVGAHGIRFCEPKDLEYLWESFGGNSEPIFNYCVIIGRWSKLSDAEKKRLVSDNRSAEDNTAFTYEQLARQANFRNEKVEF